MPRCTILACSTSSVTVRFSPLFDTHCPVQTFWFDRDGMLTRHDYTADILGTIFRGAHYTGEFTSVHGIKMATTRRVMPRLGRLPFPITVLAAAISFDTDNTAAHNARWPNDAA